MHQIYSEPDHTQEYNINYILISAQDARHWFESKGVQLKTESDGRMFPTTDNSQTIIDAIYSAAEKEGVKIMTQSRVLTIEKNLENDLFYITFQSIGKTQKIMECDSVILATGSSKAGYDIVESLGHTIVQPVPSLFTLSSKEHVGSESGILHGLSGVSVPFASVTLKVKGNFFVHLLLLTRIKFLYVLFTFKSVCMSLFDKTDELFYKHV